MSVLSRLVCTRFENMRTRCHTAIFFCLYSDEQFRCLFFISIPCRRTYHRYIFLTQWQVRVRTTELANLTLNTARKRKRAQTLDVCLTLSGSPWTRSRSPTISICKRLGTAGAKLSVLHLPYPPHKKTLGICANPMTQHGWGRVGSRPVAIRYCMFNIV